MRRSRAEGGPAHVTAGAPLPWWLRALWLAFLAWGAMYLGTALSVGPPP